MTDTLIHPLPAPGPTPNGYIRLFWFDPPQGGVYGPNARKVGGYHYALWDRDGRRLMGGTNAPDLPSALARVRRLALDKGLAFPAVEIVSTGPEAPVVVKRNSGGLWAAWFGSDDGALAVAPTYGHDTEAAARADLIAPRPSHGA